MPCAPLPAEAGSTSPPIRPDWAAKAAEPVQIDLSQRLLGTRAGPPTSAVKLRATLAVNVVGNGTTDPAVAQNPMQATPAENGDSNDAADSGGQWWQGALTGIFDAVGGSSSSLKATKMGGGGYSGIGSGSGSSSARRSFATVAVSQRGGERRRRMAKKVNTSVAPPPSKSPAVAAAGGFPSLTAPWSGGGLFGLEPVAAAMGEGIASRTPEATTASKDRGTEAASWSG